MPPIGSPAGAGGRILGLYEEIPYPPPHARAPAGRARVHPLPMHWVDSIAWPGRSTVTDGSRVLVAGCGSGIEATAIAARWPAVQVIGVDFSPRAIALAEEARRASSLDNLCFECADLTDPGFASRHAPFDFVSCHGMADYVPDSRALLRNLSACLAPHGVLYLGVNTSNHPAERVARAAAALGVACHPFQDTSEQRAVVRVAAALMGQDAKIPDLATMDPLYLAVDVFPPFAHHRPPAAWIAEATAAGLHLSGSLWTLYALSSVADEDLPLLYPLRRGEVAALVEAVCHSPSAQLLFSRTPPLRPTWQDPVALAGWRALLPPGLDLGGLPVPEGDPDEACPLTIQFPGGNPTTFQVTGRLLAAFARLGGGAPLGEALGGWPSGAAADRLVAALYRCWSLGLLYLSPPDPQGPSR